MSLPPTHSAPLEPVSPLGFPYHAPPGIFDEMQSTGGEPRPAWRQFTEALRRLGQDEMQRRCDQTMRLVNEYGVTYNVYGESTSGGRPLGRPWVLDAIPFVLDAAEWESIEAGLVQRAQLLDLITADIYGGQTLMGGGVLPPELVFANPAFLRACHGTRVPGNRHMHLYAADIARAPDGSWYVLSDRAEAPSGAGYALENRLVLSRLFPEAFQQCNVERLGDFFASLRDVLAGLAPRNRENPRVVLLTPGPYNETYFEQSFLARYLGYTLVEGGDLTVRDNTVFLKTIDGLQPVDVILRRMDSDFCDPLELREDSVIGVAGLVQAAAAGNVAIANTLGSGVVESPALLRYLPRLCRELMGEDLRLKSIDTWWYGDREQRATIEALFDKLVFRPAFPSRRGESIFGEKTEGDDRARLRERLAARPWDFVAQPVAPMSSVPAWAGGALEPRPAVLRVYLHSSGSSYVAMPGGMTRISASSKTFVVSMQAGGGSKDTWVTSETPPRNTGSLLPAAGEAVPLRRAARDLPSRVVDDLYWLGRYVERADSTARLLRCLLERATAESKATELPEYPLLLQILADQGQLDLFNTPLPTRGPSTAEEEVLARLFEEKRQGSLRANLSAVQRAAWLVRDRISVDAWRILSKLESEFVRPDAEDRLKLSDALDLLNRTIITLSAFAGLGMENMTRGQGWRFMDIGRRLERSVAVVSLLRSMMGHAHAQENTVLQAMLEVADSSMTYRSRYLITLQAAPVLDLLMMDEDNPRSIAFQIAALERHVSKLPRDSSKAFLGPDQRLMLSVSTRLRLADVHDLCEVDENGDRPHLLLFLDQLSEELPAISDVLSRTYFSHAEAGRQLAAPRPGGATA